MSKTPYLVNERNGRESDGCQNVIVRPPTETLLVSPQVITGCNVAAPSPQSVEVEHWAHVEVMSTGCPASSKVCDA